MFLNQVFNLAVQDIKEIRSTFSYISNDASHYVEQLLENVPLIDSREAHDHYVIPNRFPMRNEDIGWILKPSTSYQIISNIDVTIPEDNIGLIYGMQNTINNSIQLIPSIAKSGKHSQIVITVHNNNGATYIEKDTIIGKLMLVSSEKLDDAIIPLTESVKIIETIPEIIDTVETRNKLMVFPQSFLRLNIFRILVGY